MARFHINNSIRADCLMRLLDEVTNLLRDELDSPAGIEVTKLSRDDREAILTPLVEVARVLGVTEDEWLQRYRENAKYYDDLGMEFK